MLGIRPRACHIPLSHILRPGDFKTSITIYDNFHLVTFLEHSYNSFLFYFLLSFLFLFLSCNSLKINLRCLREARSLGGLGWWGQNLEWEAGGAMRAVGGSWAIRASVRDPALVLLGDRRHGGAGGVFGGGSSACWPYPILDSHSEPGGNR